MKTSKILERAKDKLNKGWVKNEPAVNAKGEYVAVRSRSAVKFCAVGAVMSVTRFESEALSYLNELTFPVHVVEYNDEKRRTKAQMLRLFDRAIALARKDEVK